MGALTRREYTQAQLEVAFDLIKPAGHWKDPIDATVQIDDVKRAGGEMAIREAIVHFTATLAVVESDGPTMRFMAAGYWAGPAA